MLKSKTEFNLYNLIELYKMDILKKHQEKIEKIKSINKDTSEKIEKLTQIVKKQNEEISEFQSSLKTSIEKTKEDIIQLHKDLDEIKKWDKIFQESIIEEDVSDED